MGEFKNCLIEEAGRVKLERVRLNLTQEEVAVQMGVHRVQWGRYERGEQAMSHEKLEQFKLLGADTAFIRVGIRKCEYELINRLKALDCFDFVARELDVLESLVAGPHDTNSKTLESGGDFLTMYTQLDDSQKKLIYDMAVQLSASKD